MKNLQARFNVDGVEKVCPVMFVKGEGYIVVLHEGRLTHIDKLDKDYRLEVEPLPERPNFPPRREYRGNDRPHTGGNRGPLSNYRRGQ